MHESSFWNADPHVLLRVGPGFRLADGDPDATPGTSADRAAGESELALRAQELRELQEKLFAQSRLGAKDRLLVVLQAMDAAGKGGIVNRVFAQLEPYGLALTAFKSPTAEERRHDFLWRVEPRVPGPGMFGVFDRSHYEDVLIQRVHGLVSEEEIERRYLAILDFERRITEVGVRVVKVMLHVSPEEQANRLEARLDTPEKHWKYRPSDLDERAYWADYMEAFQIAIDRTEAPHAPWYVIPANRKWYARAAVQRIVIDELRRIGPEWPSADFDVAAERSRLAASRDLRWPESPGLDSGGARHP